MAVQASNCQFDWCNKLIYARRNYDVAECCNRVRAQMKEFKGADEGFLDAIAKSQNSAFTYWLYYAPTYRAHITATYSWTREDSQDRGDHRVITTTSNSEQKSFYGPEYPSLSDLDLDRFVGRNDERFFSLSHVDDLDKPIYKSCRIRSESSMAELVLLDAQDRKSTRDSSTYINAWSCEVTFVPIAVLDFKYNGTAYRSLVNMHNGQVYCNYPISKATSAMANRAANLSLLLRILAIAITLANAAIHMFVLEGRDGILDFLISIACFGVPIWYLVALCSMKHNVQYYRNVIGAAGGSGAGNMDLIAWVFKEILYFVLAIVITVVSILLI